MSGQVGRPQRAVAQHIHHADGHRAAQQGQLQRFWQGRGLLAARGGCIGMENAVAQETHRPLIHRIQARNLQPGRLAQRILRDFLRQALFLCPGPVEIAKFGRNFLWKLPFSRKTGCIRPKSLLR